MNGARRRILKCDEIERDLGPVTCLGAHADSADGGLRADATPTVEAAEEWSSSEVDRMRRLVQAMLSGFARQRRGLLAELQPYVVRIGVEVARRIVRRELRTDPGMVSRTVGAALEQVAAASETRVRVHPLDAQVLQESIREIVPAPDEATALEIIPDGSIERGGCVVESDRGIVDARLQTQFEEMQTRLLDGLSFTRTQALDEESGSDAR